MPYSGGDVESDLPILVITSSESADETQVTQVLSEQFAIDLSPSQLKQHADIHWLNPDQTTLTIDQVRSVQQQASYHPYQLAKSFFILQQLDKASAPAQNALLKILEEPPQHVQLILTASHLAQVLPTLQSRCQIILATNLADASAGEPEVSQSLYQQIMTQPAGELVKLSDEYGDRAAAQSLFDSLTAYVHQELLVSENQTDLRVTASFVAQLQVLLLAHQWLNQNLNVKLAVTECFFQLQAKKPILRP